MNRSWGKCAVGVVVVVQRETDLPEIVRALDSKSGFAGGLHRKQQHGNQDADDRDHHKQLNQGKSPPAYSSPLRDCAQHLMKSQSWSQAGIGRRAIGRKDITGLQVALYLS